MHSTNKITTSIILIAFLPMLLQAKMELPLHQKRLSEKVLIVWIGDYMQQIATVALATEKGIVVIETSLIRAHDARIRKTIEKEFGRKDFKYVINTHFHHDHTAGNQIYADAAIIGHKNIQAGLKEECRQKFLLEDSGRRRALGMKGELKVCDDLVYDFMILDNGFPRTTRDWTCHC